MNREMSSRRKVFFILAGCCIVFILVIATASKTKSTQESNRAKEDVAPGEALNLRQKIADRPAYRVFANDPKGPTKLVVDKALDDAQVADLLWFLRLERKANGFALEAARVPQLPISDPLLKDGGILLIYRGESCVREKVLSAIDHPCGKGGHFAASYIWNDGTELAQLSPNTKVFTRDTALVLPSQWQAILDHEADSQHEEHAQFAMLLNQRVGEASTLYRISAKSHDTLVVSSDRFDIALGRENFMRSIFPSWNDDLCSRRFRFIQLKPNSISEQGTYYAVECANRAKM